MNKKVYLFELDSERKTKEEIERGQEALYYELLSNGNTVILSMNQMLDSAAIICMLYEDKSYKILKYFMENGYIRISRYGNIRTIQQYLLSAIEKNLEINDNVFIFSALPVKSNQKNLLILMRTVLYNADLSLLREYIDGERQNEKVKLFEPYMEKNKKEEEKDKVTEEDAERYLKILYRFLELVILNSMNDETWNPAIDNQSKDYVPKNFFDFLDAILKIDYESELFKLSTEVIRNIRGAHNSDPIYMNRSVWSKELYKQSLGLSPDRKIAFQYAELIINLCYNYTVEYSILGNSKHYLSELASDSKGAGSFQNEFLNRLEYDWNQGANVENRFLRTETNKFEIYQVDFIDKWDKCYRIIKRRGKKEKNNNSHQDYVSLYEFNCKKLRRKTKSKDVFNVIKGIFFIAVYILTIFVLDEAMSRFESALGMLIKSSLTFLLLMFISTYLERKLGVPDIIDCVKMLFNALEDIMIILGKGKPSYCNKHNFNIEKMEKIPPHKVQKVYHSSSLDKYKKLLQERPELFHESNQVPIITPTDSDKEDIIQKYEIKHNVHIGVNYESKYHMLLVDLIHDTNGGEYTYERLVPVSKGKAVVVVPVLQGRKYILLKQFRHALRETQIGFPRGFGENDKTGNPLGEKVNAIKEICEELALTPQQIGSIEKLGEVVADSGINGNKVAVYKVDVSEYCLNHGHEGIVDGMCVTKEELETMIKEGMINDGFTLAAWSMWTQHCLN